MYEIQGKWPFENPTSVCPQPRGLSPCDLSISVTGRLRRVTVAHHFDVNRNPHPLWVLEPISVVQRARLSAQGVALFFKATPHLHAHESHLCCPSEIRWHGCFYFSTHFLVLRLCCSHPHCLLHLISPDLLLSLFNIIWLPESPPPPTLTPTPTPRPWSSSSFRSIFDRHVFINPPRTPPHDPKRWERMGDCRLRFLYP